MLNRPRLALALAAALEIVGPATAAGQGVTSEDSQPPDIYYALHNGTWFGADSPFGPWVMADYVPPPLYTIPPGCPVAKDGILCVYNDATEYVADFSGWPWAWSFGWHFRWLPNAVVMDSVAPSTTRRETLEVKSPRGQSRSEPRSEPRSVARSEAQRARP
jgi:hypothetical protein